MRKSSSLFLACSVLCAVVLLAGCGSNPNSSIVVTLSPSSAQVDQGGTVNVSATVTSTGTITNQNVTWTLSGSGCTGVACGSLANQTPTFVTYNAPTAIPSNLT